MTKTKPKIEAHPQASDLLVYLLGADNFTLTEVDMFTWVAKSHYGHDAEGNEFRLTLAGHGAFEMGWKGLDGEYTQRTAIGHIESTPIGKAACDAAAELGRKLTGHDLEVCGWMDFAGIAAGRHLKPTGNDDEHSFILLELNDDQFAIVQGDNPNPALTDVPAEFEEKPFAEGKISRFEVPRVAISCSINITDQEAFCEAMGIEALEMLDGSVLEKKMTVMDAEPKVAGLSSFECTDPLQENGFLKFRVHAEVADFGSLVREARSRWEDCWGDRDWYPASPEEALYEVALASNANPSPDIMGFEFVSMSPIEITAPAPAETTEEPGL